ncbi:MULTISPECIES: HD domain-containing protein [Calditerrivibrio]|jgi:putative hydrolase of HD superfamily|uniref:5'-deoxynucleotidase n=1 Tax=Calditerrivibrio nitroreducens TaxID=477976 RepID=A0A2J6WGC6_9BACT|nr:MAG: phosphohydrolase [Calditerrivibrio nitroreducens]
MFDLEKVVNFFFETGSLQKMQRSGNIFLGTGNQTVASHSFRVAIIAYVLSRILKADSYKVVITALFHDIEESRTGDLNYLQQMYVKSEDEKALIDVIKDLPVEGEIKDFIKEYEGLNTLESKIVKDADTLELILFLKEELDKGNNQAKNWIDTAKRRLITNLAKELCLYIENGHYYDWWYSIRNDWENGSKKW